MSRHVYRRTATAFYVEVAVGCIAILGLLQALGAWPTRSVVVALGIVLVVANRAVAKRVEALIIDGSTVSTVWGTFRVRLGSAVHRVPVGPLVYYVVSDESGRKQWFWGEIRGRREPKHIWATPGGPALLDALVTTVRTESATPSPEVE